MSPKKHTPLHDAEIPIDQLLDQIEAMYPQYNDSILPGDLTLKRVQKRLGIGREKAVRYLARLVEDGKLIEVPARCGNGKMAPVWRKP